VCDAAGPVVAGDAAETVRCDFGRGPRRGREDGLGSFQRDGLEQVDGRDESAASDLSHFGGARDVPASESAVPCALRGYGLIVLLAERIGRKGATTYFTKNPNPREPQRNENISRLSDSTYVLRQFVREPSAANRKGFKGFHRSTCRFRAMVGRYP